jgi:tetratricopeptide (TPR) repeat protein
MSRKNKHKPELFRNGTITPEALRAYAAGELDAAASAELERYFQDDPFAAEAAEGLQQMPQTDFTDEIARMNQKIRNAAGTQNNSAKISTWVRWLAAAAMLLLLMVFGYLVPRFMSKEEDRVAMSSQEQVSEMPSSQPSSVGQTEEAKPGPSDAREITTAAAPVVQEPSSSAVSEEEVREEAKPETFSRTEKSVAVQNETAEITEAPAATAADVMLSESAEQDLAASRRAVGKELKKATTEAMVSKESISTASAPPSSRTAMKLFEQKQYAEAAAAFDEVLLQNPSAQEAAYYSGLSHFITGNYNRAIPRFDALIRENKKYRNGSLYYKALTLIKQGKKPEALPLLEELKKTPGSFQKKAEELLREP